MNRFLTLFLIVSCVFVITECAPKDHEHRKCHNHPKEETAQDIFDQVPETDQNDFIKLHLALGVLKNITDHDSSGSIEDRLSMHDIDIPEDKYDELMAIQVPAGFSSSLLSWTEEEFHLSDDDVIDIVTTSQICFPSGCVNPGDIGSVCCPFSIIIYDQE